MSHAFVWTGFLVCSFLLPSAAAQDIDRLDDHLRFLEPLMGHRWEGGEWVPGHTQEFRAKTQGGR